LYGGGVLPAQYYPCDFNPHTILCPRKNLWETPQNPHSHRTGEHRVFFFKNLMRNFSVFFSLYTVRLYCTVLRDTPAMKKLPLKQYCLEKFSHQLFRAFSLNLTPIQKPHRIPISPWGLITIPVPSHAPRTHGIAVNSDSEVVRHGWA